MFEIITVSNPSGVLKFLVMEQCNRSCTSYLKGKKYLINQSNNLALIVKDIEDANYEDIVDKVTDVVLDDASKQIESK